MADSTVQVPPIPIGGTNQVMDTTTLTRGDGTVVQRGRYVIGDPNDPNKFVGVTGRGELPVSARQFDELIGHMKRVAMLLEIMTGQEVSLDDISRTQE